MFRLLNYKTNYKLLFADPLGSGRGRPIDFCRCLKGDGGQNGPETKNIPNAGASRCLTTSSFEPLFRPMMIQKAPERRSARDFPPANGRPAGGCRGGSAPRPKLYINKGDRKGEALEPRTGGVQGGGSPPAITIHYCK